MSPITAAEAQTCCGAKARGPSLAKAHSEKGRRRLEAQDGEHVGEAHDAGPQPADRSLAATSGGPLDHARNGDIGGVVAAAEAARGAPPGDTGSRELRQPFVQGPETAGQIERDEPDDDHAGRQQDALQAVGVGDGRKPPARHVDQEDERQSPHGHVAGDRAVGDHADQEARCAELQGEEGNGEDHRDDEDEEADGIAAEVVGQHLARRQVAEAPAQHPLTLQEQHAGERYRDRMQSGGAVGESVAVDKPGMADEDPAPEGRSRRGDHEEPRREPPPGDEVRGRGLRARPATDPPEDAVAPVEHHEGEQPGYLDQHRPSLLSNGNRSPGPARPGPGACLRISSTLCM